MRVQFHVILKAGYRKTCEIEETKEMDVVVEADNYVTAQRMFMAVANMDNIEEYSGVCLD